MKKHRMSGCMDSHAQKERGTTPYENAPHSTTDTANFTTDPLIGWHDLAKPARDRQPNRGWRRKAGGAIDAVLLGLLAFLAVVILLHTGVI